ncbi:aminotransferase class I/II-fold pyridoxal phosphate-dependent enzyme [Alkaliphilus serpentinus]|nr:aminotransferase class I/II-fold pyridoxal phosphate-dependent enzyme [Alkaliphilus serpentinus]
MVNNPVPLTPLEKHLKKMRTIYKNRRNAMVESLSYSLKARLSFQVPKGGFYMWCKINERFSSTKLLQEALKVGVSFIPGEGFYSTSENKQELRLCFSQHNQETIIEGICRLEKSVGRLSKFKLSNPKRNVKPII